MAHKLIIFNVYIYGLMPFYIFFGIEMLNLPIN